MIKLIASDIDGTLVADGSSQVNPELFEVILRLKREKGIHFAAASGRQAPSIESTFEPIQKEIFYLAENGAYMGCYGRTLFLHPMDQELAHSLIREIQNTPDLDVMVSTARMSYLDHKNPELYKLVRNGYRYQAEAIADPAGIQEPVIKIAAYRKTGIQEIAEAFCARFGEQLKISISGNEWLDFMPLGVNKGEAVKTLQESLGIAPEETMAFGDQMNDLEMLERAYYSFAVGNARKEVRAAARFQADTNINDGVLNILKLLL